MLKYSKILTSQIKLLKCGIFAFSFGSDVAEIMSIPALWTERMRKANKKLKLSSYQWNKKKEKNFRKSVDLNSMSFLMMLLRR